jgi:hypothetical protein
MDVDEGAYVQGSRRPALHSTAQRVGGFWFPRGTKYQMPIGPSTGLCLMKISAFKQLGIKDSCVQCQTLLLLIHVKLQRSHAIDLF